MRGQHTDHMFWFARATSHQSDALLPKVDWGASQDSVLRNTPLGPSHAQLKIAGGNGHLDLRPATMQTLSTVVQQAQLDHALTQQGHTPLWARPTPRPTSTPGTSPRRPLTTERCGPETAAHRCSAGSASGRSGSPASPSSRSRASYAVTRRRPQYTCK